MIVKNRGLGIENKYMVLRRGQKMVVDRIAKKAFEPNLKMLTSKDEDDFDAMLRDCGFIEGLDYGRQHCFHNEDLVMIVDFVFLKFKVVVEIDRENHWLQKKQKAFDKLRDRLCDANGYKTVRIIYPLDGEKRAFWRRFFTSWKQDFETEAGNELD